ncbi:MAG TPA: FAD-dependent oxidoreductase [Steroidobacteraceae bacterium]|nr:FAD-dependent oxidoreductase [Steroidobacteraceae bacterium]
MTAGPSMLSHTDIVVLGSGPAGVAAARTLRGLGYEVAVVGAACGRSLEGLSQRTLAQLSGCGLHAAAGCVSAPGERSGAWGGAMLSGSVEYLVDRAELDLALLEDAARSGISIWAARAVSVERAGNAWRVRTTRGALECRVLIDARGRRAQRKRLVAGPSLIAVSQRLRAPSTGVTCTRMHAFPRGWAWLAMSGRGAGCLQVITFPTEPSLRAGLEAHLRLIAADSPEIAEALCRASPDGQPIARPATAALAAHPDRPGLLAVGDASVAADPLCGHGMYEALRSATVTAAAANSYLLTGDWQPVRQFIRERAEEIWRRTCETAALHYGRQADVMPTPFWRRAARAYRTARRTEAGGLAMSAGAAAPGRIEQRPVLNGTRIEMRRVVVVSDAPRGVWKVDGVELAALVDLLRGAHTTDVCRAAQQLSCEPAAVARAVQWLRGRGLLQKEASMAGARKAGEPLPAG